MKQKYLMSWDDNDDDNMRGWNPASEDDTHDNGMGRWSENNRLGLQFSQSSTDGIKLGASTLVDVVLVSKNLVHLFFEFI